MRTRTLEGPAAHQTPPRSPGGHCLWPGCPLHESTAAAFAMSQKFLDYTEAEKSSFRGGCLREGFRRQGHFSWRLPSSCQTRFSATTPRLRVPGELRSPGPSLRVLICIWCNQRVYIGEQRGELQTATSTTESAQPSASAQSNNNDRFYY